MFEFLKRKKKHEIGFGEEAIRKSSEEFFKEHEYKMEHDPEYRESVEKSVAFFDADHEAKEKAGLVNKIGSYTFTCPNCGTLCQGNWVRFDHAGNLHGRTDCFTCDIHLMV